jgi:hypothetical protein
MLQLILNRKYGYFPYVSVNDLCAKYKKLLLFQALFFLVLILHIFWPIFMFPDLIFISVHLFHYFSIFIHPVVLFPFCSLNPQHRFLVFFIEPNINQFLVLALIEY